MTSLRTIVTIAKTECITTAAVGCRSKFAGMSLENSTAGSGLTKPSPIAYGPKSTPLPISRPARSTWRPLRGIWNLAAIVYLRGMLSCFPHWNWQACERLIWTLITRNDRKNDTIMKRMERRSHRAHPHIAPDAFPISRDEGAGEGRGEGSLILQWDKTGGHA